MLVGTGALLSFPGVITSRSFGNEYELRNWMGEGAGDICLSVASSHAQQRGLEVDFG